MTTPKCKTCAHWGFVDKEYRELPLLGVCKAVPQLWDATEWSAEAGERIVRKKYAGRLAFVEDGSAYYAALRTFADFGCVQHLAIPDDPR